MNLVHSVIFKTIPPCFQVSERIFCVHFSFLREVCAHLIQIAVNWKRNGRFEQQVYCSFILCKNTTVAKSCSFGISVDPANVENKVSS
jgi:hypothetical protein